VAQREVDEFERLEATNPHGVSATQIVDFFAPRGVKLAQATFRKYVQLGLLPRSRRVGEKGKHRGSRGLYPATAVRRISLIKSLMDEGMTLEDIRHSFIFFRGQLDGVERALDDLFAALDKAIAENGELKASRRRELERMLNDGRHKAHQFVKEIERTVSQITARHESGKGDR
jgi:DNA-binding transcriptional MerR regulator